MGIFSSLLERRSHPSNPAEWLLKSRMQNAAGADFTIQGSLQATAVFACVRVLAETTGMLPLILYERLQRGKRRATEHSLFPILHDLANPEMTSMELRETLMGHVGLWGNGYAEIEYDNAGRVRGLWPLRADKVKVARINGQLRYVIRMPKGPDVELLADRVMHLRGLSYDGIVGYSPIDLGRQAVALSLATEEFGARFFSNGASLGVIYTHPGELSDTAYNRLEKSLERRHQGLTNAHRIAILEEGMDAKSVGIPPENAQFLETRKFQVPEIARLYRMPLHKIGFLENATFSNIEHQAIEFVTDTIQPWLTRWEQAIYRDLLTPAERQRLFAEHLIDALLKGDIKSRYEAYATGRQNGWLSANDIRELENMNPVEGGDVYLVPLNMVPADMVSEMGPSPQESLPEGEGEDDQRSERRDLTVREQRARQIATGRQRLANSFRGVIQDAAERVIRREVNDVKRALGKFLGRRGAPEFSQWLVEFYEEHRDFWQRQMLPILLSYAEQIGVAVADEVGGDPAGADSIRALIDAFVEALAARHVAQSQGIIQTILDRSIQDGEDPAEAIEQQLDAWEESRAGQVSLKETYFAGNAFAKAFYVGAGITRLRWVASGENCPYCRDLDGKVVGIQRWFLEKNVDFQPDGAERPIKTRSNIGHPPVHDGCDCMIVAEVG